MGGLRYMSDNRENAILQSIRDAKNGLTANELAEIHEMHYQTVRGYLNRLLENERIEIGDSYRKAAGSNRGSLVYIVPDTTKMPLFTTAKGDKVNIWDFTSKTISKESSLHSINITRQSLHTIFMMFHKAYHHRNNTNADLKANDLTKIRHELWQQADIIENYAKNLRNIADNDGLFADPDTFKSMLLADPENPVDLDEISPLKTKSDLRLRDSLNKP